MTSDWIVPVQVILGSIDHGEVKACSISRIPDEIREPKEESYKPKVVSIGPLHRGATRQILLMEEPKLRYMRELLDRSGSDQTNTNNRSGKTTKNAASTLENLGNDILKLDNVVRASYGGNMELSPHDLAKIMMVDGCFLLELLHKLGQYRDLQQNFSRDPFLETTKAIKCVLNDISMLENQIPFVVLKTLYKNLFPVNHRGVGEDHRVANLMRKAFGYDSQDQSGFAHLLELMHLSTIGENSPETSRLREARPELKRCATRLQAAGITITAATSNNVLNGNPSGNVNPNVNANYDELVDIFDFNISFNKDEKELKIPPLHIKETTEVRWRNLIAWEQSRIWVRGKYTSYAFFFKSLICCEHDLDLLQKKGVIVNNMPKKSKKELMTMFRTICAGAEHMDSSYSEDCEKLNKEKRPTLVTEAFCKWPIITGHNCRHLLENVVYYGRNGFRILIRDHIPTVWKFIAVVAATLVVVLTIMQTVYSAKQTHYAAEGH
ncbi:UPF0481 protein At3g47200-like [Arachis stenosperma]|uniref:UPF0481 protein At3g47200-like n=1 Tax=Arachis stenosperma TaxID=217475 RepID=UPI0025AD0F9F|nr:UPF0481 protein At3g47200-like [Arachis stenosperma]